MDNERYFTKIKKYYSYLNVFAKKKKINSLNYYDVNDNDIKRTVSCSFDKNIYNIDKNKFSKSDPNITKYSF